MDLSCFLAVASVVVHAWSIYNNNFRRREDEMKQILKRISNKILNIMMNKNDLCEKRREGQTEVGRRKTYQKDV